MSFSQPPPVTAPAGSQQRFFIPEPGIHDSHDGSREGTPPHSAALGTTTNDAHHVGPTGSNQPITPAVEGPVRFYGYATSGDGATAEVEPNADGFAVNSSLLSPDPSLRSSTHGGDINTYSEMTSNNTPGYPDVPTAPIYQPTNLVNTYDMSNLRQPTSAASAAPLSDGSMKVSSIIKAALEKQDRPAEFQYHAYGQTHPNYSQTMGPSGGSGAPDMAADKVYQSGSMQVGASSSMSTFTPQTDYGIVCCPGCIDCCHANECLAPLAALLGECCGLSGHAAAWKEAERGVILPLDPISTPEQQAALDNFRNYSVRKILSSQPPAAITRIVVRSCTSLEPVPGLLQPAVRVHLVDARTGARLIPSAMLQKLRKSIDGSAQLPSQLSPQNQLALGEDPVVDGGLDYVGSKFTGVCQLKEEAVRSLTSGWTSVSTGLDEGGLRSRKAGGGGAGGLVKQGSFAPKWRQSGILTFPELLLKDLFTPYALLLFEIVDLGPLIDPRISVPGDVETPSPARPGPKAGAGKLAWGFLQVQKNPIRPLDTSHYNKSFNPLKFWPNDMFNTGEIKLQLFRYSNDSPRLVRSKTPAVYFEWVRQRHCERITYPAVLTIDISGGRNPMLGDSDGGQSKGTGGIISGLLAKLMPSGRQQPDADNEEEDDELAVLLGKSKTVSKDKREDGTFMDLQDREELLAALSAGLTEQQALTLFRRRSLDPRLPRALRFRLPSESRYDADIRVQNEFSQLGESRIFAIGESEDYDLYDDEAPTTASLTGSKPEDAGTAAEKAAASEARRQAKMSAVSRWQAALKRLALYEYPELGGLRHAPSAQQQLGNVKLPEEPTTRLLAGRRGASAMAFSPSGYMLAVACADEFNFSIRIYEFGPAQDLCPTFTLPHFGNQLTFIGDANARGVGTAYSREEKSSFDKSEVCEWRHVLTLQGHEDYVYDISWSPLGNELLTASSDKTVRIWSIPSHILHSKTHSLLARATARAKMMNEAPYPVMTLHHLSFVYAARFLPPTAAAVSAVVASDPARAAREGESGAWASAILRPHPDHPRLIVSGGYDGKVRIWNRETGQLLTVLRDHVIDAMKALPAPSQAPSTSTLRPQNSVIDFASGKRAIDHNLGKMTSLPPGLCRIQSIVVHPSGNYFYSADARGQIKIWEDSCYRSGPISVPAEHPLASPGATAVANSRDPYDELVRVSGDSADAPDLHEVMPTFGGSLGELVTKRIAGLRLAEWHDRFKPLRTIVHPTMLGVPISSIALMTRPDAIVALTRSNCAYLFSLQRYEFRRTLSGIESSSTHLHCDLSPTGRYFLAGGSDGVVNVWDMSDGRMVFRSHAGTTAPLVASAWNPRLNMFAVAAFGGNYPVIIYAPQEEMSAPRSTKPADKLPQAHAATPASVDVVTLQSGSLSATGRLPPITIPKTEVPVPVVSKDNPSKHAAERLRAERRVAQRLFTKFGIGNPLAGEPLSAASAAGSMSPMSSRGTPRTSARPLGIAGPVADASASGSADLLTPLAPLHLVTKASSARETRDPSLAQSPEASEQRKLDFDDSSNISLPGTLE